MQDLNSRNKSLKKGTAFKSIPKLLGLLILLIIILSPVIIYSQEVVTGLSVNPAIKNSTGKTEWDKKDFNKSSKPHKYYDTLPFIDDFSNNSVFPDISKWLDNEVFVNNQFPDRPPTQGVATFDGLNNKGKVYISTTTPFSADTLTSIPIRLDSGYNIKGKKSQLMLSDKIYLSFYYQPGGLGDRVGESPLPEDSLLLEFRGISSLGWFGTNNEGLFKYDYINWTQYTHTDSTLLSNKINCITLDDYGNAWIGFQTGGLLEYNGNSSWTIYDTVKIDTVKTILKEVNSIAIDYNGFIWVGTNGQGLAQFNGIDWQFYNTGNSSIITDTILSLAIDTSNIIWIGTKNNGLEEFKNDSTWISYNTSNNFGGINAISVDNSQNIWIGNNGSGLSRFDRIDSAWTFYNKTNSELPGDTVFCIAIDAKGNKWIGTNYGLAKFNNNEWTIFNTHSTTNTKIQGNIIKAIDLDSLGNTWVSAYGKGISKYNNSWENFTSKSTSEPIDSVTCIAVVKNNLHLEQGMEYTRHIT